MTTDTTILQCLQCKAALKDNAHELICTNNHTYPKIGSIPCFLNIENLSKRDDTTRKKFEETHTQITKENCKEYLHKINYGKNYSDAYFLNKLPDNTQGKFLEIGCGGGISGYIMEKKGYQTYGIDFAKNGLDICKEINNQLKSSTQLIQGDMRSTPYKDNMFDVTYGGGTLEHIEDTQCALNEIYRITKPGGVSINSVPIISLSSLTYRQLSGNIPDIPILKSIFTFMHEQIFKTKFMHTGYEKSFFPSALIKMHKKAGFTDIKIEHNHIKPELQGFPDWAKPALQNLEKYRPFWLAITIIAKK